MKLYIKTFLLLILVFSGSILKAQKEVLSDSMQVEVLEKKMITAYQQGAYQDALLYIDSIIIKLEATIGPGSARVSEMRGNAVVLQMMLGNYSEAEELALLATQEIEEKVGRKTPQYATALNNLAGLYQLMGRYEEAKAAFEELIPLEEEVLGADHPDHASTLNNFGMLYDNTNQLKKAAALYQKAMEIWKAAEGREYDYAIALQNLAGVFRSQKNYKKAKEMYLEAYPLLEQLLGVQHPDYNKSLLNLANLYIETKNYTGAEKVALKILAQLQGMEAERQPILGATYVSLAELYFELDSIDAGFDYILKTLATNSKNDSSIPQTIDKNYVSWLEGYEFRDISLYLKAQDVLLGGLYKKYLLNKEEASLRLGIDIVKMVIQSVNTKKANILSEEDKARLLASGVKVIEKGLLFIGKLENTTQDLIQTAYAFMEYNKSILLSESLKGTQTANFGNLPDSLQQQEGQLKEQLDELNKMVLSSTSKEEQNQLYGIITETQAQLRATLSTIKEQYPRYYSYRYQGGLAARADSVQASLGNQQALLEYFVGDEAIYAFYLDKKTMVNYRLSWDKATLEKQVKTLRGLLTDYNALGKVDQEDLGAYIDVASLVYENILAPVLQGKNLEHLIIVPDHVLSYIPFEALLTKKVEAASSNFNSLPYLLKAYTISYHYSGNLWRDAVQSPSISPKQTQILAAAASYGQQNDSLTSRAARAAHLRNLRAVLQDLPAARAEVKALEKQMTGSFWEEANEAQFKAVASQYNIIHLAMHGLMNEQHPILSSLAFTENGDSTEDNFLQAYEISQLELNAQLVVLSACETGYGKFQQGEGVMSLARSFMYAGVPSLVVSLWQVNDQSTSLIMQAFYANLAKGLDKAAALRQAKLSFLETVEGAGAHPAFWAAFIQLGDSRPVDLPAKGSSIMIWVWVLGIPVVVIVVFWRVLRRRLT